MRKLGINLVKTEGVTTEENIRYVSEAGFDCVFSGVRAETADGTIPELLAKYGLEYETLHASFDGINDIWFDNLAGETMLSRLIKTVDVCKSAGVGKAVVHLSSGTDAPVPCDAGFAHFRQLVEHAEKQGVVIAFENQRKIGNIGVMLEYYENNPFVGFCWDVGHENCFTPGRDYMGMFGKMLVCTHIHDNRCIYNKDDHMLPFDGNIDFESVAARLVKYNYTGPLTLEVMPRKSGFYNDITMEEFVHRAYERAKRLAVMTDGE